MTLPVLYPHLRIALNRALQMPKHFMHGSPGMGAREVQVHIALEWGAVVIAPKILHRFWQDRGLVFIYSPQYLRLHPEVATDTLVVDVGCGHFRIVQNVAKFAKKLSIRQTYGNTVAPVEIKKLGAWR